MLPSSVSSPADPVRANATRCLARRCISSISVVVESSALRWRARLLGAGRRLVRRTRPDAVESDRLDEAPVDTVEKADAHGAEIEEMDTVLPDEGEHGSRRRRLCRCGLDVLSSDEDEDEDDTEEDEGEDDDDAVVRDVPNVVLEKKEDDDVEDEDEDEDDEEDGAEEDEDDATGCAGAGSRRCRRTDAGA